jgi:hypothetical protein
MFFLRVDRAFNPCHFNYLSFFLKFCVNAAPHDLKGHEIPDPDPQRAALCKSCLSDLESL